MMIDQTVVTADSTSTPPVVKASLEVTISGSEPVFLGHFPSYPLLPGVMLLGFARQAVAAQLKRPVSLKRIVRQRFMRPVRPDTIVHVECDIKTVPHTAVQPVSPQEGCEWRVQCRWKLADGSLAARAELIME